MTTKNADPFFYAGLILSFVFFTTEILVNSIVIDSFKYSFFFWLDIIATLSLIPDIAWILDALGMLIGSTPSYLSVNAIPGVVRQLLILTINFMHDFVLFKVQWHPNTFYL